MVTFNDINIIKGRFPNNEIEYIEITDKLIESNKTFKLIYENNEDLFNLMVMKKALDQYIPNFTNLNKTKLIIPFFPYSQMDRAINGKLFSLKYVSELINSLNFDIVKIYDPHSNVLPALIKNCVIEYPIKLFMVFNKKHYDLVIYPDNGAAKKYSELLDIKYRFGNKVRDLDTGKILKYEIIADESDIEGKSVIIIDDLCMGGRTFKECATVLHNMGASNIDLFITHLMPQSEEFVKTHKDYHINNLISKNTLNMNFYNIDKKFEYQF